MQKELTIEIHGTGTHNRGAELMAIAIGERMRRSFPGCRIVVPPMFGDYRARAGYGFHTTWEIPGRGRALLTRAALQYGSAGARQALGVVDPTEIDVVLDASGFAFSDQWGTREIRKLLDKMARRRPGTPLILLPQALGPFKNEEVARLSRELFSRASLVCARDRISHSMAANLGLSDAKLRLYPDFTPCVAPCLPEGMIPTEPFVALVPNLRMLDKGGSTDHYLPFLEFAAKTLREKHMNPHFVLHDAKEDQQVVSLLESRGVQLPVLKHSDPRVLKGMLGSARLVIGSRFHALVSAMSQCVPCIGVGWSHKYQEVFSDFDCLDWLTTDLMDHESLRKRILEPANSETRSNLVSRLRSAVNKIKRGNEAMWNEVEGCIHHMQ